MWQRFTERARRIIFFSEEEAALLGENYVSTEHLLLALTREPDCVAMQLLERLGVRRESVRTEVELQVARGDGVPGKNMQLTPRGKRVIDLAYDEAREFGNNFIGTEHLLLGLVREGEGLAGRVLSKMGVTLEAVREAVTQLRAADPVETTDPQDAPFARERNLPRPPSSRSGERLSPITGPKRGVLFGDLGTATPQGGRSLVEMARTLDVYYDLDAALRARDAHAYRELTATPSGALHQEAPVLLLAADTPLKLLLPPWRQLAALPGAETPASDRFVSAATAGAYYVRVLEGDYADLAGWIKEEAFTRTGPDEAPFPPEPGA